MKKNTSSVIAVITAVIVFSVLAPKASADFSGGVTPLNLWTPNVTANSITPVAGLQVPQNSVAASSTSVVNVNNTVGGVTNPNGSFLQPYPSISSAIAGVGASGPTYFNLAPGTYVDGAPDTFPSSIYIQGNQSTYVAASGATFPGTAEIYDTVVASPGQTITFSSTSTTQLHQANNSTILANVVADGILNMIGTTFPSTTSTITVASSGLLNFIGGQLDAVVTANAQTNYNDMEWDGSTTGYGITQAGCANGGCMNVVGMTYINTTGDGINLASSGASVASGTENNLLAFSEILGASATSSVNAGSAYTDICDSAGFYSVTGVWINPLGTNWAPCYDEKVSALSGLTVGTTSVPTNLLWDAAPSSTVRIGVTSTWPGCIEMYDAAASGTLDYIYTSGTALVDTSTKPTFCQ